MFFATESRSRPPGRIDLAVLHEGLGAVHIDHHEVALTLGLLEQVLADRQVVLRPTEMARNDVSKGISKAF